MLHKRWEAFAALLLAIALACGGAALGDPPATPLPSNQISGLIDQARLPAMRWPNFIDYQLHARNFYASRNYPLAWLKDDAPTPAANAIIAELELADEKGLRPEDYDGGRWSGRVARLAQSNPPATDNDRAAFDLALTIGLMRYISDLHVGRVSPKAVGFDFDIEHRKYDLPKLLSEKFVEAKPEAIPGLIVEVEPPYAGYYRTEQTLKMYRELAMHDSGAGLATPPVIVAPGDRYPDLAKLVQFLRIVGDLKNGANVGLDPPIYQQPVVDAVKRFQQRHGLDDDGRLGAATIKEMNVPLSRRAEQLRLSLERWRWAPQETSSPPILINIPEFVLHARASADEPPLRMRVVVGKAFHHKTPVFVGDLKYVVFRPYWNVPMSIQRKELLPKMAHDPAYLANNNYEVVSPDGKVIGGEVTDSVLNQLRAGRLAIRQKPGGKNSLGLVKFIFPNEHSVYLHDTPSVTLFAKSRRDFSHGCIRVQDPAALAVWVLRGMPGWDREKVIATMHGTRDNVQVTLSQSIPVIIIYSTAYTSRDGTTYFFDDIYGYDAELEKILTAGYPFP